MTPHYDITERYRPATLDEFIGNAKAVQSLRLKMKSGLGGRKLFISGVSGVGKTTLGLILAREVAEPSAITTYVGRAMMPADVRAMVGMMGTYGFSATKPGRAVIINEIHGLRADVIEMLLDALEPIPPHCIVIATTTRDGQAKLFDAQDDAGPLLSRFEELPLTSQGCAEPFAARLHEIALAEGFDVPLTKCKRVLQERANNMRKALQWIGSPECMGFCLEPVAA